MKLEKPCMSSITTLMLKIYQRDISVVPVTIKAIKQKWTVILKS